MAEIRVDKKDENRNPIWPWILGALVLIGLIWGISELLSDNDDTMTATRTETTDRVTTTSPNRTTTDATAYTAQGPVNEYLLFVERNDDEANFERTNVTDRNANGTATTTDRTADRTGTTTTDRTNTTATTAEMGLDHEYTSEGIRKLSDALEALATSSTGAANADIDQRRQTFKQRADQLQKDPQSLQHSNTIRATFMEAAELMSTIKENNYPNSDADVDKVREAAEDIEVTEQTLNQKDDVREFFREAGEALQAMDQERQRAGNTNMQQNQNNQ